MSSKICRTLIMGGITVEEGWEMIDEFGDLSDNERD
jgi:hypothetical protein